MKDELYTGKTPMEFVSMTCRNCGGNLHIIKDADQVICLHCGTEYLVSFSDNGISIKLLSEGLKRIQASSDKTASELALSRIKKEKEELLEYCPLAEAVLIDTNIKEDVYQQAYELEEEIGPMIWLKILRQALQSEKSKLFSNKQKIADIEDVIEEFKEYVRRWDELKKQEQYHHRVVDQR